MKLLASEFNVLNKIATKSKMDCWFYIAEDGDKDIILDCETGERHTLYDGINMLADGMTSIDDYELTEKEKLCFATLMYKLEVVHNEDIGKYKTFLANALTLLNEVYGDLYYLFALGMNEEDYFEITGEECPYELYEPMEEKEDE